MLNIDIAPTLLDIAGVRVPGHMDGVSFLPHLRQLNQSEPDSVATTRHTKQPASPTVKRDSFLVERGYEIELDCSIPSI